MRMRYKPGQYQGYEPENQGFSMTVPDQVQPLKLILERRNNGVQPPFFNGSWSGEDLPDINKMDFIELAEFREEIKANIETLKEDFHALTKRLEKAKRVSSKENASPGVEGAEPPGEQPQG